MMPAAQVLADELKAAAHAPATGSGAPLDATAARERFRAAMDDDLDTPAAVAALRALGREICDGQARGAEIAGAQATLRELADVLGLTFG